MLGCGKINEKLISLADAVRAEVLYEVSMSVDFPSFYLLSLQKQFIEQEKLNFNLYKHQF